LAPLNAAEYPTLGKSGNLRSLNLFLRAVSKAQKSSLLLLTYNVGYDICSLLPLLSNLLPDPARTRPRVELSLAIPRNSSIDCVSPPPSFI